MDISTTFVGFIIINPLLLLYVYLPVRFVLSHIFLLSVSAPSFQLNEVLLTFLIMLFSGDELF